MFGGPKTSATPPPGDDGGRPQTARVAQITGTLTHVFVHGKGAGSLDVFVNGQPLLSGQVESLSVEIVAPGERDDGTLTGILSYFESGGDGGRTNKSLSLFPGTVELIAENRRVSVTCAEEGSFEGLFLRFGTENDGIGLEASGVKSLRIVVTPELRDVRLVWVEDGREDILLG
ncbi:MAG: hypothetical protein SFU56_14155 [Capsulimonadales bacterium]|nr:hypothetical protein [Capsulimonadales bacterium]